MSEKERVIFMAGERVVLNPVFTDKLNEVAEQASEKVTCDDGTIYVDYMPRFGYILRVNPDMVGRVLQNLGFSGGGSGDSTQCYKVVSIEDDYLVCHTWDGEDEGDDEVIVAKPWMLRHELARYPWIDSLTTVDEQTVDVEVGEDEYQWKVTPEYYVGCLIQAADRVTELEVGGDPVLLMDMNHDGRTWGEVQPEEEEE